MITRRFGDRDGVGQYLVVDLDVRTSSWIPGSPLSPRRAPPLREDAARPGRARSRAPPRFPG